MEHTEELHTAEQRAMELRDLADRAEQFRLKRTPTPVVEEFSFRTTYFEEAAQIIS